MNADLLDTIVELRTLTDFPEAAPFVVLYQENDGLNFNLGRGLVVRSRAEWAAISEGVDAMFSLVERNAAGRVAH